MKTDPFPDNAGPLLRYALRVAKRVQELLPIPSVECASALAFYNALFDGLTCGSYARHRLVVIGGRPASESRPYNSNSESTSLGESPIEEGTIYRAPTRKRTGKRADARPGRYRRRPALHEDEKERCRSKGTALHFRKLLVAVWEVAIGGEGFGRSFGEAEGEGDAVAVEAGDEEKTFGYAEMELPRETKARCNRQKAGFGKPALQRQGLTAADGEEDILVLGAIGRVEVAA